MGEQDKGLSSRHRPLFRLPSLSRLLEKVSQKDSPRKNKVITPKERSKWTNPVRRQDPPSPTKATRLPPEIVMEIVKLATDTFPAPFSIHRFTPNPSSPLSFASADDLTLERALHSRSMAIKRNISLISREWNILSTELLFNSVRIVRKAQIRQLWQAFESRKNRLGETSDGPGCAAWSVRLFWVDDEIPKTERISPELYPENPSLLDFVVRCRHIIVFRGFGVRVHSPLLKTTNLLPVLSGIVRSTQNRLWASDDEEKEGAEHTSRALMPPEQVELEFHIDHPNEMTKFLKPPNTDSLDAIKVLKLHSNGIFLDLSSFKPRLCFPNLVELHLAALGALQLAVTFVMPSLTKVVWDLSPKDDQTDLDTFLAVHGEGLLELSLRKNSQDLRNLDRTCPHLHRLSIVFEGASSTTNWFTHTSLQVLGIHNLHDALRKEDVGNIVTRLIEGFPSLQVVQDTCWKSSTLRDRYLRNWSTAKSRQWQKPWREFMDLLRENHIDLIDWRGRPVVIQPKNGLSGLETEFPSIEEFLASYEKARGRVAD